MHDILPVQHAYLIPLLPLLGAAIAGFLCTGRRKPLAHWPIWLSVGASAALSIWLLVAMVGETHHLQKTESGGAAPFGLVKIFYTWIEAGAFKVDAGFFIDPLTAVMLGVVCGVGLLITIFAAGYMKGEAGYFRFFAYLGLFIFAMTCLVMGENLVLLYLGWEGVGLCSYLLIGYYYDKPAAREAAKKAFLVNRVGDFGFALGIMLIYLAFGTVSYFGEGVGTATGFLEMLARPSADMTPLQQMAVQWGPFLLLLGAIGKSAQFPLYVWLPDAMEGPTPVSALIHAATMVTAGVYMIARCGTLYVQNEAALITVAVVGAFTALLAGTIALRQFDLKKVFAYSTVSQLGFMFVGVGVLAPVTGVFHLVTHAFFKALLFLSSGVVMHAMMGELDLRKMSGLKRVLPQTRWLILAGCLALAGLPPLAGFFSKDEIVAAAWAKSPLLGGVLLLTAFLTAYYTFRLYFRVFEGPLVVPPPPADGHGGHAPDSHGHDSHGHDSHGHGAAGHNHEPAVMMLPLWILAIGAVVSGFLLYQGHTLGHFLGHSPSYTLTYHSANVFYGAETVDPVALGAPDYRDAEVKEAAHAKHLYMMIASALIAVAGIAVAYVLHLRDRARAERLAAGMPAVVRALDARYWVDELYQNGIVEPLRRAGRLFFGVDRFVVDGLVWLVGFVPQLAGFTLKLTVQRGYLQGYAAAMLLGVAIILLVIFT